MIKNIITIAIGYTLGTLTVYYLVTPVVMYFGR
jgi:hypothetical protein